MLNVREIHRPRHLEEAVALLQGPAVAVLGGGTELIAHPPQVETLIDLSELGLSFIREQEGDVVLGATSVLADLANSPLLRAAARGIVAQAAHRSAASILRNQATVAGTLITDPAGILATVLLALGASLSLSTPAAPGQSLTLGDFLRERKRLLPSALVTAVVIPGRALHTRAAVETVARTPRDKPIVTACASLSVEGGKVASADLALGGVAETAVRAGEGLAPALVGRKAEDAPWDEAAAQAAARLDPPGDFRGSSAYRREMARVLAARALRSAALG